MALPLFTLGYILLVADQSANAFSVRQRTLDDFITLFAHNFDTANQKYQIDPGSNTTALGSLTWGNMNYTYRILDTSYNKTIITMKYASLLTSPYTITDAQGVLISKGDIYCTSIVAATFEYVFNATSGLMQYIGIGFGITGTSFEDQQTILFGNPTPDPRFAEIAQAHIDNVYFGLAGDVMADTYMEFVFPLGWKASRSVKTYNRAQFQAGKALFIPSI